LSFFFKSGKTVLNTRIPLAHGVQKVDEETYFHILVPS
jgi:hypothetical protein